MVLIEDLDIDSLPNELQTYLRTYTYIDARNYENDLNKIRKRIRFAMPGTPLREMSKMHNEAQEETGNEPVAGEFEEERVAEINAVDEEESSSDESNDTEADTEPLV